jgi:esterase/lipase superfamily enzyme
MRCSCRPFVARYLLLVLLFLCGCRTAPDYLVAAPVVYSEGGLDPFSYLEPWQQTTYFDVLYATDRAPEGSPRNRKYGTRVGQRLRIGLAQVKVGPDEFQWQHLHDASTTNDRRRSIPLRLLSATEWAAMGRNTREEAEREQEWAELLNHQLRIAGSREVLVYVHGFNNPFASPVCRAAQLYHFLGHGQVCLAYSWPSQNSMWRYLSDLRRARASVPQFVQLLEFLAWQTDVEQINILSYSSGARVVSEGLLQLYEANAHKPLEQLRQDTKIGRVLFVASDADLQTFTEQQLIRYYDMPRSIGITVSRLDKPLRIAAFLSGAAPLGIARVPGMSPEELEELADETRLDVVDLSYSPRADLDSFRGHFYWYTNAWVLTDILASFRFHFSPAERGLLHHPSRPLWYFPDDYPQRITELLRRLIADEAAGHVEFSQPLQSSE